MLDERFTQAEKEKIIEAFKEWEVATHHILSFYYIGEFDHHGIEEFSMRYSTATDYRRLDRLHILKYTPEDMFTYFTSPSDEPNRVIGGTLYYGMFLIPGKLELQTSFKGVAIHEIGHYIGLDHVNSTKMIMCSTCSLANCASDNPVITTEDVELFCSVSNLCAVKVY